MFMVFFCFKILFGIYKSIISLNFIICSGPISYNSSQLVVHIHIFFANGKVIVIGGIFYLIRTEGGNSKEILNLMIMSKSAQFVPIFQVLSVQDNINTTSLQSVITDIMIKIYLA